MTARVLAEDAMPAKGAKASGQSAASSSAAVTAGKGAPAVGGVAKTAAPGTQGGKRVDVPAASAVGPMAESAVVGVPAAGVERPDASALARERSSAPPPRRDKKRGAGDRKGVGASAAGGKAAGGKNLYHYSAVGYLVRVIQN